MCGRDLKTLTFCRSKFRQNFGPFADKMTEIFEIIHPETKENEVLALYPCIFENIL